MQQPNTQQPVSTKPKRALFGFVLSLVAGILILARGVVRVVAGDIITFAGSDEIRHRFLTGIFIGTLGAVAVVFGIIIIIGAYFIYTKMELTGGILVLIFSLLSILVGSGWLIGLILGVIGAILALMKK